MLCLDKRMRNIHQTLALYIRMRDMSDKNLAKEFSIGGAQIIDMNASVTVREHSGESKTELEKDFKQELSPMKDYAQTVGQYSGASLDAFKDIFKKQLNPPLKEAQNVPVLQQPLMKAIENGFDNPLMVNAQSDALKLSDKAKEIILNTKAPSVMQKVMSNNGR